MKLIYEYIEFNLVQQKEKTSVYAVRNTKSQAILGFVAWHCAWRQYCFGPIIAEQTIFSAGCLGDIKDFIGQLTKERK